MKRYALYIMFLLIVACSSEKKEAVNEETAVPQALDPETFKSKLESTPEAVLLDVRTPEEIAQGVIAGASTLDFKSSDFDQQLAALDKNKTYFVYCASGGRSGKTCDMMKEKGFTKVYSLEGGITAWTAKGLSITAH